MSFCLQCGDPLPDDYPTVVRASATARFSRRQYVAMMAAAILVAGAIALLYFYLAQRNRTRADLAIVSPTPAPTSSQSTSKQQPSATPDPYDKLLHDLEREAKEKKRQPKPKPTDIESYLDPITPSQTAPATPKPKPTVDLNLDSGLVDEFDVLSASDTLRWGESRRYRFHLQHDARVTGKFFARRGDINVTIVKIGGKVYYSLNESISADTFDETLAAGNYEVKVSATTKDTLPYGELVGFSLHLSAYYLGK